MTLAWTLGWFKSERAFGEWELAVRGCFAESKEFAEFRVGGRLRRLTLGGVPRLALGITGDPRVWRVRDE